MSDCDNGIASEISIILPTSVHLLLICHSSDVRTTDPPWSTVNYGTGTKMSARAKRHEGGTPLESLALVAY